MTQQGVSPLQLKRASAVFDMETKETSQKQELGVHNAA
jgi:hypothetical protein